MGEKNKKLFLGFNNLLRVEVFTYLPKFYLEKTKQAYFMFKRSLWLGAFLFLVFLGLTISIFPAQALFILGGIGDMIGKAIGWMIWANILILPMAFLGIASTILSWSIDPWFIRLPYTSGGIIAIGWPITRDLANMGIVLSLVIIGLATALRLEEYHARKTLPRLIIIALLINFTPVILGFIVDFANIVMEFFLEELTGFEVITNQFETVGAMIANDLGGFNFFNPVQMIAFSMKIMIIAIFDMIAGVIFLLYAVLFMMRRIIIWMLVIFSPIAFVSYILPATRGLWKMWWNQFIQWTIIGVYAAFFLYLGEQMIVIAAHGGFVAEAPGGGAGGWMAKHVTNVLNQVLPYLIALLFILFGFFVALTSSAAGSGAVINLAKKGTKAAGAAATGLVGARVATWSKEKFAKSSKAREISERMAFARESPRLKPGWGRDEEGESQKGIGAWAKRKAAGTLGLATGAATSQVWAVGRTIGRAGLTAKEAGLNEVQRKEGEKKKKEATVEGKLAALRSDPTKTGRVATLNNAYDEKQLKGLEIAGLREEEIEKIGREALEIHPGAFQTFKKTYFKAAAKVAQNFPEIIQARAGMTFSDEGERVKYHNDIVKKLTAEMNPNDIGKMAPSNLKSENVQEAIHEFWNGNQIAAAAREFGKEFADSFQEKAGEKGLDWYLENNPKVPLYLASNGAQELGFNSLEGLGTDKVREQIKTWKMPDEDIKKEITSIKEKINELRRPQGTFRRVPKEKEEEAKGLEKGSLADYEKLLKRKEKFRAKEATKAKTTKTAPPEKTSSQWHGKGKGKY